jgi:trimeric autotransporter adhesin
MRVLRRPLLLVSLSALALLCACSNGRGSVEDGAAPPPTTNDPPPTGGVQNSYSIGGTVAGLTGGGLVLKNNGGDNLPINANGGFSFATLLASGAAYNVTVASQPAAGVSCAVANGSGNVAAANVTNVTVTCTTVSAEAFSIGGAVSGLTGSGLSLRLNEVEDLVIQSNGAFTFSTQLARGASYRVTIRTQPASQTCTVQNDRGVVGGSDVASVRVACAASGGAFTVGGAVAGLLGGSVVLQNNRTDDLTVSADGPFTFRRKLATGASYEVRVAQQPQTPPQNCTVARGSGTVGAVNVVNVSVTCTMSEFTIGGVVRNLSGSGLILRNNGVEDLAISSAGRFTFPTPLPTGVRYDVTIAAQPRDPMQTCSVQNGSGVVREDNVESIVVECATQGFRIRGRVSDLEGEGLVLQNNGGDDLPIASNGRFTFATTLPAGSPYNVTVARQPERPRQACRVRDGVGTVRDSDVNDIRVRCDDDDDDDDDD